MNNNSFVSAQEVLEAFISPVAIFSPTLEMLGANAAFLQIFQLDRGDKTGWITPLTRNLHREISRLLPLLEDHQPIENFEIAHSPPGKKPLSFLAHVKAIYDAEQHLTATVLIMRDITTQKHDEHLQSRLAAIIQNSNDAIISKTLEGIIVSWNPAATKLFGYEPDEVIGKPIGILFPPDKLAEENEIIERIKNHETVGNYETIRLHKGGWPIHVSATVSPILDANGQITGISKIVRDVSWRKRGETIILQLLESAPDAMVIVNSKGEIVLTNARTQELFGYTARELVGHPIEILIPKSFRQVHPTYRDGYYANPRVRPMGLGMELFGLRKDGSEFPVEISLSPLETESGLLVSSAIRDITERKKNERALAEERVLLRTLIDTLPDYIYAKDIHHRFILSNIAHSVARGVLRHEEIIGKTDFDFFPREMAEQFQAEEQTILETGVPMLNHEHPSQGYTGGFVWAVSDKIPLRNLNGEITGLVGVTRDVTQAKQAQEEIRKLNAELEIRVDQRTSQLAFLVEASALLSESLDYISRLTQLAKLLVPYMADWCAVDIIEKDGIAQRLAVVHSDPSKIDLVYEMQRRYPPDTEGQRGLYHVLNTGKSELYQNIPDTLLEQLARDDNHLRLIRAIGLKSAMVVPLIVHGQAIGAITLAMAESNRHYELTDLTLCEDLARRASLLIDNARLYQNAQQLNIELEQRVLQRTAQLEAANKELEAFSYSVSHDLRAPLRALDGFSQALLEDYEDKLDEEGQNYLQRIRSASQRMGHLIDDLIQLARVTRSELHRESVNLSLIAKQVAADLRETNSVRHVEFTIQDDLIANADAQLLRTVLENLIGNAWKFTGKNPESHIEFGMTNSIYFVRDNGVGFDMAYSQKLFGAFQRLHSVTEFDGTGIGLASVQRIIHRHGGKVWAESAVNKGATFYFTLPE